MNHSGQADPLEELRRASFATSVPRMVRAPFCGRARAFAVPVLISIILLSNAALVHAQTL